MFEKFYIRLNIGGELPTLLEVSHDLEYGVIQLRQKGDARPRACIIRKTTSRNYAACENSITCSRSELSMILSLLLKSALTPGGVDVDEIAMLASPDGEWDNGTSPLVYAHEPLSGYSQSYQVCGMSDTGFFAFDIGRVSEPSAVDDKTNPRHYHFPNGTQLIDITENLDFCSGNAIKYIARAGNKAGESRMDDLRKAQWYLDRLSSQGGCDGN